MKSLKLILSMCTIGLLALATATVAQDADKDKLIEIEKVFAANPDPGAKSAALAKQYIYEGNMMQLTPMGRVGSLPKARLVELSATPNPADPDAKSAQSLSDFRVDVYGFGQLQADQYGHRPQGPNAERYLSHHLSGHVCEEQGRVVHGRRRVFLPKPNSAVGVGRVPESADAAAQRRAASLPLSRIS
jgi:hypothetical protein